MICTRPNHNGWLFDDLTFNNFGYGGDPNNVSRLFLQKGKIYTFNANFRRDANIFDYNLLANPLNPTNSNPYVPILNSPHEFLMTRRMTDLNLRLFPTSKGPIPGGVFAEQQSGHYIFELSPGYRSAADAADVLHQRQLLRRSFVSRDSPDKSQLRSVLYLLQGRHDGSARSRKQRRGIWSSDVHACQRDTRQSRFPIQYTGRISLRDSRCWPPVLQIRPATVT